MVPLFINLREKVQVPKVIDAKLGCSTFFLNLLTWDSMLWLNNF